jgi:hypothetical protein
LQKLINGQVCVTQDLSQQTWLDSFVVGHGDGKMAGISIISQANMAALAMHDAIANLL